MAYILRIMYCVLRIMSCLLAHDKINNKAGKLSSKSEYDLIMADVTDAKTQNKIHGTLHIRGKTNYTAHKMQGKITNTLEGKYT